MKALVLRELGADQQVEDIPQPQPRAGEVLIQVAACGLCHSDLHVLEGDIAFPLPCVLGHEVSGTVMAVGTGVTSVSVGSRVVSSFIMPCNSCSQCEHGNHELCEIFFERNRIQGVLLDGESRLVDALGETLWMYSMAGLAEYAVVPASAVFPLPDILPLAESAILGCALFTAFGALKRVGRIQPGEAIAVIATGGVGSAIVQLASALGASPIIAVDVDDDKLARASTLGATHVINSLTSDAHARIMDITDGRGVDVVVEALGSSGTIESALSFVGTGGRLVLVGLGRKDEAFSVPINATVRRKISILGSYGANPARDMPALIDLAATGAIDLRSMVTRRVTLAEAAQTFTELSMGGVLGRAIISLEHPKNEAPTTGSMR